MSSDTNSDRKFRDILKSVEDSSIASIKNVASGITKIINDLKSTAKDLEDLIKLDPPLTAKVLKVANSAYYSVGKEINTIEDAIIRVGFDTVNFMALGQKVRDVFEKGDVFEDYSRVLLWKHSIAVSTLGKLIYKKVLGKGGQNIYTAGLLHNIGIIAEDQFMESDLKVILKKVKNENRNLSELEDKVLGFNHAKLGQAILELWNLPEDLVMAVGFHHNPLDVEEKYQKNVFILHIADYICQENSFGYCDAPQKEQSVFDQCCKALDLDSDVLDSLVSDLNDELARIEEQGVFDR